MLKALFETMRPRQWTKNGFVFVALLFDGQAFTFGRIANTIAAFSLLCLMSSAVYLMNDLADIESDRKHPTKRFRPLPAGELSPNVARIAAGIFAIGSIIAGYFVAPSFALVLIAYLAVQVAYTFWLKHVVLFDVASVATGFVLRIAAGVAVIEVARFSPWLYVFGGFLALFMILGKRRNELVLLGDEAASHRKVLAEYSVPFVDILITIVTTSCIVSYTLYSFLAEGLPDNNFMMLTIPLLIYGVFRYLYLIHIRNEGGAPEEILLKDRPMQVAVVVAGSVVVIALYLLN